MNNMATTGLDFETYGAVDLRKHGRARYMEDDSFRVLIGATYHPTGQAVGHQGFDFVCTSDWRKTVIEQLKRTIDERYIVAQNALFEQGCLQWLGLDYPDEQFIDSAVVARGVGAGGSLEAAAPQLLNIDKMEMGKDLIGLFSIPGPYQKEEGHNRFVERIISDHPEEWHQFMEYCKLDARLGFNIVSKWGHLLPPKEFEFDAVTRRMNQVGWTVDLPLVEEMNERFSRNVDEAVTDFRRFTGDETLNLNSPLQLQRWCAERGIKSKSFNEKNVARIKKAIEKKLPTMAADDPKTFGYQEVLSLLNTKQIIGGSSLKKLDVIVGTTSLKDGRLRDQYMHLGAGQSWRTTGRSVQMQNLKRLGGEGDDMAGVFDETDEWDNDRLAKNLRQCFTSSHPLGSLLVGDFSSVENRGLAWLAGDKRKLELFRQGRDMYKQLVTDTRGIAYDLVTKEERQFGKVGELACGYQSGATTVVEFASTMGVELTLAEAQKLVDDWRSANVPATELWAWLDQAMRDVIDGTTSHTKVLPDGFILRLQAGNTPTSLTKLAKVAVKSVEMVVLNGGDVFMRRVFHGCHIVGNEIRYYKPSERKTGDLWSNTFTNPKTGQKEPLKLYGGKLTGILTQSFCRELFMLVMREVDRWVQHHPEQLQLIGQFHDEIVVDWVPGALGREGAMADLRQLMSDPGPAASFPLAADIKHDFRYTK